MSKQNSILRVDRPDGRASCLVADSPHSGCEYPDDFGYACDIAELRKAEDAGVDALFDFFPALGAPFLQARFPRSYIDPNRRDTVTEKFEAEGEQDFFPSESGLLRDKCTPRSNTKIYDRKLGLSEAFNRAASCHRPYHEQLKALLDEAHETHGKVVHVNCHSMPSTVHRGKDANKYDIIIGTREGETCAPEVAEKLRDLCAARGYVVGIDVSGYRGAEIVRRSGDPAAGRHSLQIEINRRLYLDEDKVEPLSAMAKLRDDLKGIMTDFAAFCDALPAPALPSARLKKPGP